MNPSNEPADLLRLLDGYYKVHETRKGERHVDCPLCGKPASARQTHFSYSARGGFCFVCQRKVSLHAMCERLHLVDGGRDKYLPAPAYMPKEKVRTVAQWTHNIPALLTDYTRHPRRVELWQAHKPLSRESIQQHGLGVGVLPNCSCKHERLIIPIRQDNAVVNFFGRAITCDCAKWLPPGGAGVTRWLFGIDDLSSSGTIWIVENKADAILLRQYYPDYIALSPSAISVRDEWDVWAQRIKAANPQRVIVALDNDLAGNGGGTNRAAWLKEWRDDIKVRQPELWRTVQPPTCAGVWLANRLLRHGLPVTLFQYPAGAPRKASVVDLITQKEAA